MKTHKWIPVVIAFVALLGAPLSHVLNNDAGPRGGMICGCSDMGRKCTMISCPGCCGALHDDGLGRRLPEMTLEPIRPLFSLKMTRLLQDISRTPATVFLDVPDKPPRRS